MSEFTRSRTARGGLGRGRPVGPRGLPPPVTAPTGPTRPARFRPNLSLAGRRIEASSDVSSSESRSRERGQSRRGDRGRGSGRGQRRARGERAIIPTGGIFSEGVGAQSVSDHGSSDLGKLVIKQRCMRADPTETDEQALSDLMNKECAFDDDISIPPVFIPLIDSSPKPPLGKGDFMDLLLRKAKDQLEGRCFLVQLPRALPYILHWLDPIPMEQRIPEDPEEENFYGPEHLMYFLPKGRMGFLDIYRSGRMYLRFQKYTGEELELPTTIRRSAFPQKVCHIKKTHRLSNDATFSYLGDVSELFQCCIEPDKLENVDYWVAM